MFFQTPWNDPLLHHCHRHIGSDQNFQGTPVEDFVTHWAKQAEVPFFSPTTNTWQGRTFYFVFFLCVDGLGGWWKLSSAVICPRLSLRLHIIDTTVLPSTRGFKCSFNVFGFAHVFKCLSSFWWDFSACELGKQSKNWLGCSNEKQVAENIQVIGTETQMIFLRSIITSNTRRVSNIPAVAANKHTLKSNLQLPARHLSTPPPGCNWQRWGLRRTRFSSPACC